MSYCGTYSGTAVIKAYSGIEYKQLGMHAFMELIHVFLFVHDNLEFLTSL